MKGLLKGLFVVAAVLAGFWAWEYHKQERIIAELGRKLDRLRAEELVADVAVLSKDKRADGTTVTKLSFVQYRPNTNEKLFAKTFEIRGEEFYVDALVVRFEDKFVEVGDGLRGKSLLLF